MKRTLFLTSFLICGAIAFAQSNEKKVVRMQYEISSSTAKSTKSTKRTPTEQKALVAKKIKMEKDGTAVTYKAPQAQPAREERTTSSN